MTEIPGNAVLSQALGRAASGRPAIFGDIAVGVDEMLKRYNDHLTHEKNSEDLPALSKELSAVANQFPRTSDFLRFVFEDATLMRGAMMHTDLKIERLSLPSSLIFPVYSQALSMTGECQ